jgi:hypothetical protein
LVSLARTKGKLIVPETGGFAASKVAELLGRREETADKDYADVTIPPMLVIPLNLINDLDPAVV